MKRIPVQSSDLESVGYDAERQILEIEFHSGGVYWYMNVPQNIYFGLMSASSKGRYFSQYIRDNRRYPYRKISG